MPLWPAESFALEARLSGNGFVQAFPNEKRPGAQHATRPFPMPDGP